MAVNAFEMNNKCLSLDNHRLTWQLVFDETLTVRNVHLHQYALLLF